MRDPVPLVEVTRQDLRDGRHFVESRHHGHVAIVTADGAAAGLGDPERITYVRSTAKPFQATACLEALDHRDGLTDAEVAVGWSSHTAAPPHLEAVRALLARSATDPDQLTCPPATTESDRTVPPARLLHNCSGKHALFALAARALAVPRERILALDGPLQRRVLSTLGEALGPPAAVAIDGCGAPAVAVPLVALAAAYRRLASEDRWRRTREAGFVAPALVGGPGRLESALLAAGTVAKPGAEGVFAVGVRDPAGGSWGIAVKAEDGADRAASAAVWALVAGLDADVAGWTPPPPRGGGEPVGEVRPSRDLAAFAGSLRA